MQIMLAWFLCQSKGQLMCFVLFPTKQSTKGPVEGKQGRDMKPRHNSQALRRI